MEQPALVVEIRSVPAIAVVYQEYAINSAAGSYNEIIADGFAALKAWGQAQGIDPDSLLQIGVARVEDQQLVSYCCCIEAADSLAQPVLPIATRILAGDRYAVVTIPKDAPIGEMIGRFFVEYVPANQIEIDPQRESYEAYFANVMELRVPLM